MAEHGRADAVTTVGAALEEVESPRASQVSIEELLSDVPLPAEASPPVALVAAPVGVRVARLLQVTGRVASLSLRGEAGPLEADIAPEVEVELVQDALVNGDSVLVEVGPGIAPLVVGVLQTRRPRELHLRAGTVHIEGDNEVVLRSGRGALRIREDGDIEVVGSRISAASRGLFRIVGRLLRLN
ncbi:hypothetical protein [Chondromyces crocatus]|uniref:Uncharacterized protein n=1 Tax=Chondromyces crocatus TaxID=52 RepID=A0A0K1E831_CHOCO|nr:hypothetical protein [Chondromyces crocatus]AKT37020.1 uncharacterized protein CMC5_011460 [Chondromyces crocatus]